ncbi:MAG TPA: PQQ-binding-like beta-propeller repeat protein [Vicinamibacterales bacterium]|nr:PQQ-binding-like beta-propeller repeat protein [Vicinamibacterales bacterium]
MAIKLAALCAGAMLTISPVLPRHAGQAPPATELIGTWVGSMEHDGKTTPLALEFEKRGDDIRGVLVVPAFRGKFPLGVTRLAGNQIETQALTFDFDRAAGIISITLPEGILPRYRPRMSFHRSDKPFVLPERRDPPLPQRLPVWTADLGAPLWADVAVAGDVVFAGADDGRLHAIEARTGRGGRSGPAARFARARPSPAAISSCRQTTACCIVSMPEAARFDGRCGLPTSRRCGCR